MSGSGSGREHHALLILNKEHLSDWGTAMIHTEL